jgi:hypothetical protein
MNGNLPTRAAISARTAWFDGAGRVTRAPLLLAGVWALTIFVSLPLTIVLRGMIARHLGDSLEAATAASGVNPTWMAEFMNQSSGVGTTFDPAIIGFAAVLGNVSDFLDNVHSPTVIVAAASAYMAGWLFLAGGILDRYARDRPTRASGFFAASGVYFWRFLRLGAIQWVVYALLFRSVHPLLFDRVFSRLTHETSVERTAFLIRVALYVVFVLLIAAANLVFDYAKVRAVVEDRRSMLASIVASVRFVGRTGAARRLYVINVAVFVLCLVLYAWMAPGAQGGSLRTWIAFAIGQVYVLLRLWIKLVFWASETALFQGRLAHAGYVAAPQPTWPDSPAAEAIMPLAQ